MITKVNFFNPFEKGFFGKSITGFAQSKAGEKAVQQNKTYDSVSDFCKHFENLAKKQIFEKSPKSDTLIKNRPSERLFDFFGKMG